MKKLLGKKGGDRFFYYPTRIGPHNPKDYGYEMESVKFSSRDGTKLHGWFLPARGGKKAHATVVFSHGNAGSMGYHFGFITWLVNEGYHVLMYDYRGFGFSEGKPERSGMIEDVLAAMRYVKTRKEVDPNRLVSFGHSLGGAKSIAALGKEKVSGLRAVISHAGFSSYTEMARVMGGEVGANVVGDEWAPRDWVSKIGVPLLIIHGEKDGVVPFAHGEELFARAGEPKTFFRVQGGDHQRSLVMNDGAYRKKVLQWLAKVLN